MKKFYRLFLLIFISYFIVFWLNYLQYLKLDKRWIEQSIKNIVKSDVAVFTQWLFIEDWKIFMSSWNPENVEWTKTQLWILEDWKLTNKIEIKDKWFFWEWSTIFDWKIFWTFWKNKKIFSYDKETFEKIWEIDINTEWWWLTTNWKELILSDWTDTLTFFNKNLKVVKKLKVKDWVDKLNELEYIEWKIYANIWLTNDIVVIDENTWEIERRVNFDFLEILEKDKNKNLKEMNWIAYDKERKQVILTWKMWSSLYYFNLDFFK